MTPHRWSLPRWVATVMGVLGAQVGLIWVLSDRTPARPLPLDPGPTVLLVANRPAQARLEDALALPDPSLFALPSRRGFSGPVWWDFPRPHLHLADWTERESWLQPRLDALGAPFLAFARAEAAPPASLGNEPTADIAPIPVPNGLFAGASTLSVEGALRGRPLMAPIPLPSWTGSELLRRTVVQVAVNPAGRPVVVVLLQRSGLKAADDRALTLARTARFQPLPAQTPVSPLAMAPRTWGKLVFRWHVVAPAPHHRPSAQSKR